MDGVSSIEDVPDRVSVHQGREEDGDEGWSDERGELEERLHFRGFGTYAYRQVARVYHQPQGRVTFILNTVRTKDRERVDQWGFPVELSCGANQSNRK